MFFAANTYAIRGKVALVTGALGAIGQETSLKLASLGASLVLVGTRPKSESEKLCEQINQMDGVSAIYVSADVRKSADIERMFAEATRRFFQINILVNIAGIALYKGYYTNEDKETIDAGIDINLRAPMELTRLFVKELKSHGREGVVVNLASFAGLVPREHFEVYGTTKAALIYFTKASQYLAPQIRISAVAPFFVDSPMVNKSVTAKKVSLINRHTMLSVADVAQAVVNQIESRSSAGKTVMIIGGSTSLPVWLYEPALIYVFFLVYVCWAIGLLKSFLTFGKSTKTLTA
ncbi:hypothetical protein IWW56_000294 [Coemansia sp. RSA 2131]|nr:hypothetical protein IWW56_000294 [Coemansia sp. RSA 2131]